MGVDEVRRYLAQVLQFAGTIHIIIMPLHLVIKPINKLHIEVEPIDGKSERKEDEKQSYYTADDNTDDCWNTHNASL